MSLRRPSTHNYPRHHTTRPFIHYRPLHKEPAQTVHGPLRTSSPLQRALTTLVLRIDADPQRTPLRGFRSVTPRCLCDFQSCLSTKYHQDLCAITNRIRMVSCVENRRFFFFFFFFFFSFCITLSLTLGDGKSTILNQRKTKNKKNKNRKIKSISNPEGRGGCTIRRSCWRCSPEPATVKHVTVW